MTNIDATLDLIGKRLPDSIASLLKLISFPSISSEPKGSPGIANAAAWLQGELSAMGLEARSVETAGHPVVLATSQSAAEKGPTLLFYGHYDVQPVGDPRDWTHPPFDPVIVDEQGLQRIYGRGASDSKSQLWAFVEALRAWKEVEGGFPGKIIILLEGEEESGSASLADFLATHREDLACDVAFICDSDMWARDQPALTTQLKGLLHEKVTIRGPNPDLHSGLWGAVVVNPLRVLSTILAGLHDETGMIRIDGFYDGVTEIPDHLRREWSDLSQATAPFDGISLRGGVIEPGFAPLEAMWARPTVDINGITGGNQGPTGRSVLPGSATARLTMRLVPGQDPERIRNLFRAHVTAHLPDGCLAEFEGEGGCSASESPTDSPYIAAVARGLEAEWHVPTVLKGSGGAIPFVQEFNEQLGVDCILIGFILGDDAIHAPNERYDTERFHKSLRSWVRILNEISHMR